MKVIINRTQRIRVLRKLDGEYGAQDVANCYGFKKVDPYDIDDLDSILWEGIEFNRLFKKDGVIYRFNEWTGEYPFDGIELQEIGFVPEEIVANPSR